MDGKIDLERIAAIIDKEDPDLVALQEVDQNCERSGNVNQAAELGRLLKMNHRFGKFMKFQGGEYGMAVLSRFPIEKTTRYELPRGAEPRCALEIQVRPDGWQEPLSFIGIHNDWTKESLRVPQISILMNDLVPVKHPVILAGDFNAERRDASLKLLQKSDWKNLRDTPQKTWPSVKPTQELDYFIARGLGPMNYEEQVIPELIASDHRPISVRINRKLETVKPTFDDGKAILIHRRGEHDCHTFRIPGLAKAKDGSLLGVYDIRYESSRDLQGHMDIGLSRSSDNGLTWAKPRPIMDMGAFGGKPENQNGCSDPCILVDDTTGEIFVFALWSHGRPGTHQWYGTGSMPGLGIDVSSQFMVVRSTDHGLTWSKPENLTKMVKNPAWYLFAPAPGNGITLNNGTLVIPSQGRDAKGQPFSNITYSKDHGKTWTVSSPARSNTTESAVAQLSDGSLMLNMRDNRNRKDKSATNGRAISVTHDLGKTWTVHPSDHSLLPEPVCMASLIRHNNLLLFSNPHHRSKRTNITLRASSDDGQTWPHQLLLDSAGTGYGYSSLTMIDDDSIGILYESSQADMTFQRIKLSDLLKK